MVSKWGHIYSLKSNKFLKLRKNNRGYLIVSLYPNSKTVLRFVHRLVLEAFNGEKPSAKHQCNHKDGNKQNNHIDNLEWVTCSENRKHAYKNGLHNHFGERHPSNKLMEQDVKDIRYIYSKRLLNQRELADIYNVSIPNISAITRKRSWRYI